MFDFDETGNILRNDDALKDTCDPDKLPEREDELKEIRSALAPVTRGSTPENMLIYGPAGQGKTVGTNLVLESLEKHVEESLETSLDVVYVNCADLTSSYQVSGELLKEISPERDTRPRGHGASNIYDMIFDRFDELSEYVTVVLDEVDSIGDDDTILYQLSRAEQNNEVEDTRLSVIGISNDLNFHESISERAGDTLQPEEILFTAYNAKQLNAILRRRADRGLYDGSYDEGVIQLCGAFAAQRNGSARQAIRLLYKSARTAHDRGEETITEGHVREAQEVIERDILLEGLRELTTQQYAAVLAIASLEAKNQTPARTKVVYREYKNIAESAGIDVVTTRSIRENLQAMDLYNFLNTERKTGGTRGGERLVFELAHDLEQMLSIEVDGKFSGVVDTIQTRAESEGTL